jgi:uncharacterized protein
MLTGQLVRARVRGSALEPSFVDVTNPRLLSLAQSLVASFQSGVALGWTRGQLTEQIDELIGEELDHKVLRGLAKVVQDNATFEVQTPIVPADLREIVFGRAHEMGPLALEPGPLKRTVATDVFAELISQTGLPVDVMERALYADLADEQQIVRCDLADEHWLLARYNVALVQALLLRTVEVVLVLHRPSSPRLKQLFRAVKFHQLLHLAQPWGDGGLRIVLDGPTSMFRLSTRYGLQLANFFPNLLHQDCQWEMTATVLWTKARHRKKMVLTSQMGLKSHSRDSGGYETREQKWFAERFLAAKTEWTLDTGKVPISLGGHAVLVPDFTFTKGERVAHLEIVGFWRKEWLEKHLECLSRWGPGNVVVAVSRKLRGGKAKDVKHSGLEVIDFAAVVPAKKVLAAVEGVALPLD